MTLRISSLILSAVVVSALTGCGEGQKASFSDGVQTSRLIPQAQVPVRNATVDHFGDPQNLVAWLKFPIDYGEVKGVVTETSAKNSNIIKVRLTSSRPTADAIAKTSAAPAKTASDVPAATDAAGEVTESMVRGAGLLWTKGAYTSAVTEARSKPSPKAKAKGKKGKEAKEEGATLVMADFRVLSYDAAKQELALNARLEEPVAAGDEFVIVGHNLQTGRKLYMQHCMHCHGVSGDGNGTTARYLNPLPRDYRLGRFKFTSTRSSDKVSREDLVKIVREGIPGTYMPSFLLLKDQETHDIVEYVRWLAVRGEFEKILADGYTSDYAKNKFEELNKKNKDDYQKALADWKSSGSDPGSEPNKDDYDLLAQLDQRIQNDLSNLITTAATVLETQWRRGDAATSLVVPSIPRTDPDKDTQSVMRGRDLFLGGKAKCASCHGVSGRGDGPQTQGHAARPDDFGGGKYPAPGLYDDWGQKIKPRDLTTGIYRGGRRPIDIYRRIHSGIKGTPMTAFGTALNDKEIWDLVNYVMSVPHERDRLASPPARSNQVTTRKTH